MFLFAALTTDLMDRFRKIIFAHAFIVSCLLSGEKKKLKRCLAQVWLLTCIEELSPLLVIECGDYGPYSFIHLFIKIK